MEAGKQYLIDQANKLGLRKVGGSLNKQTKEKTKKEIGKINLHMTREQLNSLPIMEFDEMRLYYPHVTELMMFPERKKYITTKYPVGVSYLRTNNNGYRMYLVETYDGKSFTTDARNLFPLNPDIAAFKARALAIKYFVKNGVGPGGTGKFQLEEGIHFCSIALRDQYIGKKTRSAERKAAKKAKKEKERAELDDLIAGLEIDLQ